MARERAMKTMELRDIKPALALAVHCRALVRRVGALVRRVGLLTTRDWTHHIVDRWRDAVSNRPAAPADIFTADEPLFPIFRQPKVVLWRLPKHARARCLRIRHILFS